MHGLGVMVHRHWLGVARRLGVLFDEFATSLGVAGREGRGTECVERLLTVDAGSVVNIWRSRGKAMQARSEEGRHGSRDREGEPVQDGEGRRLEASTRPLRPDPGGEERCSRSRSSCVLAK